LRTLLSARLGADFTRLWAAAAASTASGALLPAVVAPERLPAANARLAATFTIANQFAAKPLGAWLFVWSAAAPFGFDALTFAVAAALVARIRSVPPPVPRPPTTLRADIAEGLRWLWGHRLLRTLAVSMGLANVAFCAAFAIFVLYASQRLGLSAVGYGFLLTTFAIGGLAGAAVAARLGSAFGSAAVLRAGLVVEVLTHVTLALTTNAVVAAAILVVFGIHTMVWGVLVATIRQRAVPAHLLGRVGSVYSLLDVGGAALGSLLGGLLASAGGLTTPFWLAAAAMAAITLFAWRPLRRADGQGPGPGWRRDP
jgi:predicted MFS family arabinose efflux permease